MPFKTVLSCPKNIDTIVCYTQHDAVPHFSFDFYLDENELDLSAGTIKSFRIRFAEKYIHLILVGFDYAAKNLLDDFRKVTLKLGTKLNELKSENIFVEGLMDFTDKQEIFRQFSSTLPLCDYAFDKYKQTKADYTDKNIFISGTSDLDAALSEGKNIAKGICIARDLTNEPSDVLTPYELANRCVSFGKEYGFEVEIFDKESCEELGMTAFLTVSRGSAYEPNLIVMRYLGNINFDTPTQGVIGKGLCYDSGGLYLKPGASMEHSKADMAGGASVIGVPDGQFCAGLKGGNGQGLPKR